MNLDDETAAAIEEAVLAAPGVADLFRARPTLGSAVESARRIASRASVSRIVLDDDVLRVVIGTDGAVAARTAARAAHDAALRVAGERGLVLGRVEVRIARVG